MSTVSAAKVVSPTHGWQPFRKLKVIVDTVEGHRVVRGGHRRGRPFHQATFFQEELATVWPSGLGRHVQEAWLDSNGVSRAWQPQCNAGTKDQEHGLPGTAAGM